MGKLVSALGTVLVIASVMGFGWLMFGPSPEEILQGPVRPLVVTANNGPVLAQAPNAPPSNSAPQIASAPNSPPQPVPPSNAPPPNLVPSSRAQIATAPQVEIGGAPIAPTPTSVPAVPTPQVATPITRIAISRIKLDSEVVEALLIDRGGATTWDIPKFKAGHAQLTAGAGDQGNAVLLGHVSSLRSGDVFKDLESVKIGDEIVLFDDQQNKFTYVVSETRTLARTDMSMLATTDEASATLFTCTGTWLPLEWDFSDRFIVRAKLRDSL